MEHIKGVIYRSLKTFLVFLQRIFETVGLYLLIKKDAEKLKEFTVNLIDSLEEEGEIDSIVFSKDRAMQLHAFLSSYQKRMYNRSGRVLVLFKCSDEEHYASYHSLQKLFAQEEFLFIEEVAFRDQLIDMCNQSRSGKIIFFVDDMIFTHDIDYRELTKINTRKYVLSLSRGEDLDYSIVLEKELRIPPFTPYGNLFCFKWNYFKEYNDWTFPLGLSGYMYGRREILAMLRSVSFRAPNSLEWALQVFLPFYSSRFGVCAKRAACTCVHANLVQSEGSSPELSTFSVAELLSLWKEGWRINIDDFYNLPLGVSQMKKYSFTRA